ncbi:MAG: TolC family protein, partial [Mucinivorans sp.]
KMKNKIIKYLAILTIVVASGCVTKPYKSPDTTHVVDSLYRVLENQVDTSFSNADLGWRYFFTDTLLISYIEQALANNYDMRIALANIAKAEAQLRQSKAAYSPSFSASMGYGANMEAYRPIQDMGQVGVKFGWEIDLWGKIASVKRSAYASLWAEQDTRLALQSTIIARLGTLYYTLVGYDAQKEVIEQTIINRKAYLVTTRQLKESAQVNEVAVQQAIAQLSEVEAAAPELDLAIVKTENAFRFLMGQISGPVVRHPVIDIKDVKLITRVGCPAQLLSNRMDVRAAEQKYRAAHEMWNMSRAAMYPSLTISADGNISDIFRNHFGTLNLLAGLTEPIWNGRKLRTQKEVARLTADQAEYTFQSTLLRAGQEVSDALASQLKTRDRALSQVVQLRSLRLAYEYSMELFVNGYATYLDVLLAQTGVFNTEISLIQTYLDNLNARIELYRALGGGAK